MFYDKTKIKITYKYNRTLIQIIQKNLQHQSTLFSFLFKTKNIFVFRILFFKLNI